MITDPKIESSMEIDETPTLIYKCKVDGIQHTIGVVFGRMNTRELGKQLENMGAEGFLRENLLRSRENSK